MRWNGVSSSMALSRYNRIVIFVSYFIYNQIPNKLILVRTALLEATEQINQLGIHGISLKKLITRIYIWQRVRWRKPNADRKTVQNSIGHRMQNLFSATLTPKRSREKSNAMCSLIWFAKCQFQLKSLTVAPRLSLQAWLETQTRIIMELLIRSWIDSHHWIFLTISVFYTQHALDICDVNMHRGLLSL